ncbi:glycoside hydrolase family 88 protein [Paenibacillus paeoniae]|nr:glycoside hydrolase family 88 protein [Paenibacillus paeoniae]
MQRFSWEQGVAAQALIESGYIEEVVLLAHDACVRQTEEGRLGIMASEPAVTDPASNGEAVLFAWKHTNDEKYKIAADRMLNYLLNEAPRTRNGAISHMNFANQVWVDSFYMAPPFIAVAGHVEEAVRQVEAYRELLWNAEKKLFSHMWDDDNERFIRNAYWGVGNGWAAAGLIRVIRTLPDTMAESKQRLIGYLNELIEGCLTYQREDGLFYDVLDDSTTFVETNVAQMLAYAIYSGVKEGWLREEYLANADKMRAAANNKVDSYGIVQGVCGSPNFNQVGTATEGQAFYMLMETAKQKLG